MTATQPLLNEKTENSAMDVFGINTGANGIHDFSKILQEIFSLSAAQSSLNIFSCGNKSFAKDFAKKYVRDYWRVRVSSTTHSVLDVRDVTGERVFPNESSAFGWVIFIDKNLAANWGHECEYILFNNGEEYKAARTMPPMKLRIEEIE